MPSTAASQPLSLKQARVIEAVARLSDTGRAGGDLNMSQSTVSRLLSASERQLGTKLFQRGWGGSEPTSEGEIAVRYCGNMDRLIGQAERELAETAGQSPRLRPFLEWRHLETLSHVARTGSASNAAQLAGISQPAVSRALSELNRYAGQQLFKRHKRGLTPDTGVDILLDLHAKLQFELSELSRQLDALAGNVTGRLAVGVLPISGADAIPRVFGELAERYPHLRLLSMQGPYDMLAQALLRGEIDCLIGVMRNPSPYGELTETPLLSEAYALVAREDHPCHNTARTVEDLAGQNWVVGPHGTPVRAYFESLFTGTTLSPPAQTCEMLSFNAAEQILLNSNLIALLPYSPARKNTLREGLKLLDVPMPEAEVHVGVTLPRRREQPAPVTLFLKTLEKYLE